MKSTVTIYEFGQIRCQFDVVGFEKAVSAALVHLQKHIEPNIVRLGKNCTIDCQYLMKDEWSCTVTSEGEEVYGLTVERAS